MTKRRCEDCKHYRSGEYYGTLYFGDQRCAGSPEGRWLPPGESARFERNCGPGRRWWKQAEEATKTQL